MQNINLNMVGRNKGLNAIFGRREENKNSFSAKAGDILSAVIEKKTEKTVALRLKDDSTCDFPSDKIQGEQGDEIYLQVVSADKKGVSLKQIDSYKNIERSLKQMDLKSLKELMQKSDFIAPEENILAPKQLNEESEAKLAEAIRKLKRQLSYASGNLTGAVVAQLAANGIAVEKISVNVLNSAIKEVISNPKKSGVNPSTQPAAKGLLKKLDDIGQLSHESIAKLIKDEKPLTIENIYKAKYSAVASDATMPEDTLESLLPEIQKAMEREKIDITPENLAISKFLAKNELPINAENIKKVKLLRDLNNSIDKQELLNNALTLMQDGSDPLGAVIAPPYENQHDLYIEYENIINDLQDITPEHINLLNRNNIEVTIKNLQSVLRNRRIEPPKNEQKTSIADIEASSITHRRQLAEIQLKLNFQAAVRLADKNIRIDTMPLQQVVENLRALESEKYAQALEAFEAPATPQNIEQMSDVFRHIYNFVPTSLSVITGVANQTIPFTVEAVGAANAAALYESQTVPNPKYGDSMSKVQDQFAPLLESLGIEPTEANIRAAEILTKNNMEINPENLAQIKLIDTKINDVYERLNPYIAADMIKNGLNPSEMNIDEVIEYINNFSETFGDNTADKIAKYIKQMDDSKTVTKQERDSVLAIYRMLNQIQKDGASAVGAAYKADMPLTLGNLLEAAKIMQKSKGRAYMDTVVSDESGAAERRINSADTIKEILQKTATRTYDEYMLRAFSNYANGETLGVLVRNGDFEELSVETAAEKIKEIYNDLSKTADTEKLASTDAITQNVVRFMQENQIPYTLNNIDAVKQLIKEEGYWSKEPSHLRERIKQVGLTIDSAVMDTSLSQIKEGATPNDIMESIAAQLNEIISETDDADIIGDAVSVRNVTQALSATASRGFNKLPIIFNDKLSEINMYVLNDNIDEAGAIDTFISLDAGSLGEVSVLVRTEGGKASLIVSANADSIERLEKNISELNDLIAAAGFEPSSIVFKPDKIASNANQASEILQLNQSEDSRFEAVI